MPFGTINYTPAAGGSKATSLSAILDAEYGTTSGLIITRGGSGWIVGTLGSGLAYSNGVFAPVIKTATVPLAGVVATTGGAIATWQPTEGGPVVLLRCIVNVTTKSTGAANLSVGQGSSATTSYTNLITASDVGTAVILLDSLTLQAAAVAAQALLMPAVNYVTFTGSADTSGLVGSALIQYWKP